MGSIAIAAVRFATSLVVVGSLLTNQVLVRLFVCSQFGHSTQLDNFCSHLSWCLLVGCPPARPRLISLIFTLHSYLDNSEQQKTYSQDGAGVDLIDDRWDENFGEEGDKELGKMIRRPQVHNCI